MSLVTDARSYADNTIEQGRTALSQGKTAIDQGLAELEQRRAELDSQRKGLVRQGRAALRQAAATAGELNTYVTKGLPVDVAKPAFAAIGAAGLLADTVTKRVESLPADTAAGLAKVQDLGRARVNRAGEDAVATVSDVRSAVDARIAELKALRTELPTAAKQTGSAYLAMAKNVYGTLTEQGEARFAELRKDPRVVGILHEAGLATPAPKTPAKADAPAGKSTTRKTTARKSTARKTTARKTTAAKAPAKRAATKAVPAKKAVAKKATATRATAAKKAAPAKRAASTRATATKAAAKRTARKATSA